MRARVLTSLRNGKNIVVLENGGNGVCLDGCRVVVTHLGDHILKDDRVKTSILELDGRQWYAQRRGD